MPAFELLHELVERPGVLDVFGYSKEQVATTVLLLGGFVGARGLATCEPDAWAHRQRARADRRAPAEEAPFLQPLFFQLLCRRLLLLALADCLTCACFGIWSQDRRSFFPDLPPGQPSGLRWVVQSVRNKDFGVVTYPFSGPMIDSATQFGSRSPGRGRGSAKAVISWMTK